MDELCLFFVNAKYARERERETKRRVLDVSFFLSVEGAKSKTKQRKKTCLVLRGGAPGREPLRVRDARFQPVRAERAECDGCGARQAAEGPEEARAEHLLLGAVLRGVRWTVVSQRWCFMSGVSSKGDGRVT